jgi:hypothetical protein
MTDPTLQQIKEVILQGLKEVGERFARDPTPTDGSVKAALAIAAQKKKKPATPRKAKANV